MAGWKKNCEKKAKSRGQRGGGRTYFCTFTEKPESRRKLQLLTGSFRIKWSRPLDQGFLKSYINPPLLLKVRIFDLPNLLNSTVSQSGETFKIIIIITGTVSYSKPYCLQSHYGHSGKAPKSSRAPSESQAF
jgi:hypothetical protein